MKIFTLRIIAALAAIFMCGSALAKNPIEVSATSNDTVGNTLVYQIKQQIIASQSLYEYDGSKPHFQLEVVTLDQFPSAPGTSTTYSYTLVFYTGSNSLSYFLTSGVGYCGTYRVSECATSIVAAASNSIDEIQSEIMKSSGQ